MSVDVRALEEKLGLSFRTPGLLEGALTHPLVELADADSALLPERLTALGEGLLPAALSVLLHRAWPSLSGEQLRTFRQCAQTPSFVADVARKGELGRALRLPPELVRDGSRDRDSVLSAAFLALLGACFVDQGLEPVLRLVATRFRTLLQFPELYEPLQNPKQELLKLAQQQHLRPPEFKEIACWGKQHCPTYKVGLYVDGLLLEQGEGGSRKEAEAEASRKAVTRLRVELAQRAERLRSQAVRPPQTPHPPAVEVHLTSATAGSPALELTLAEVIETVQPVPAWDSPWWETVAGEESRDWEAEKDDPHLCDPPSSQPQTGARRIEPVAVLNAKGKLLELHVQRGLPAPEFRVEQTLGPPHARTFVVGLYLHGKRAASGEGSTRREAEQRAARAYLTPPDGQLKD